MNEFSKTFRYMCRTGTPSIRDGIGTGDQSSSIQFIGFSVFIILFRMCDELMLRVNYVKYHYAEMKSAPTNTRY
jgi:hypothetical protein